MANPVVSVVGSSSEFGCSCMGFDQRAAGDLLLVSNERMGTADGCVLCIPFV